VLADRNTSLTLAASLHPSAAVCGTPSAVADELITELEGMDRGRYAGPVGWMDASGDGEWGIALRCGAFDPSDPSSMRLFAGCGIVAGSDPDSEVAESDAKLVPMRDALTAR
jgi:menaquinone-specific isochorismate synthase